MIYVLGIWKNFKKLTENPSKIKLIEFIMSMINVMYFFWPIVMNEYICFVNCITKLFC